jgi:transposase
MTTEVMIPTCPRSLVKDMVSAHRKGYLFREIAELFGVNKETARRYVRIYDKHGEEAFADG